MDRDASLKTVQNQKVFIPLSAVMEIQENFYRLVNLTNGDDVVQEKTSPIAIMLVAWHRQFVRLAFLSEFQRVTNMSLQIFIPKNHTNNCRINILLWS